MCVFRKLLGSKYDQGPLAFIKVLLLLRDIFKVLRLRTLKLRAVWIYKQTSTINNKQYTKQYKQSKTIL
jgi:hypothetical protein